jgi:hypothetical protein
MAFEAIAPLLKILGVEQDLVVTGHDHPDLVQTNRLFCVGAHTIFGARGLFCTINKRAREDLCKFFNWLQSRTTLLGVKTRSQFLVIG